MMKRTAGGNCSLRNISSNKWFLAITINFCVLFLLLLLFPNSEKTDDLTMKLILSGAFSGKIDAHLLYINYLLGLLLSGLQRIAPRVAWYEVSQYITIFVSLTAFTYVMLDKEKYAYSAVIILPVLFILGFECYNKITFTKTSAIAVGTGFLLLLSGFAEKPKNKTVVILGLVQLFAGCLYRAKMIYGAFPLFFGTVLIEFFCSQEKGSRFDKKLLYTGILLAVITGAAFCINAFGIRLFSADSAWANYKEYNEYKVILQDYGWPDYAANEEVYQSLGVSQNDYIMWTNRDYGDPTILTVDLMGQVSSIKESPLKRLSFTLIRAFFQSYPNKFLEIRVIELIILLILVLFSSDSKRKVLPLLWLAMVVMAEYFYFFLSGRYGRHHIDTAMSTCVAMYLCYYLRGTSLSEIKTYVCSILAVILCLFAVKDNNAYILTDTYTGSSFSVRESVAKSILETFAEDEESLYILSNDEYYGLMRAYGVFDAPERGELNNIFVLSAYMYPSHRAVLEGRGIENIYEHFCDDNVYYACSASKNADTILRYLREHYFPKARKVFVENLNGVKVYKYYPYPLFDKKLPLDGVTEDVKTTNIPN